MFGYAAPRHALYMIYVVEAFPSQIQSTVLGIIEVFGKIGTTLAPFTVRLTQDQGFSALVVTGIIQFIFGVVPTLFLKETLQNRGIDATSK